MADRPSRSLPPTPVGDSAARERSPVRPVRMASVSPQGGAQAAAAHGQAGSVGQRTGGSGGGTTTDLMVRSLEKVMQQLQGMSNQFGELRLTNERQQRQLDDLLTGFRGLERQVNSGEGVGGQGVAPGASPQRPSAQGAGSGTPAWGSSNLPDPWRAAWETARLQGAGSTTYSGPDGQRGPHSGVGGTTSGAPTGQGPNGVFGPSEGPDPPPGFAPQEGPFGAAEGANSGNWYSGWQDEAWSNWRRPQDAGHGSAQGGGRSQESKDAEVFQRSERWMPPPPVPEHKSWGSRLQEVTGFLEYTSKLVAWVGLGHDKFPQEISHAVKETAPLGMERLTEGQKARAVRLLAILKLGFADHGKASTLLRSYTETGGQSGFEAIRLLAREFSVRSRQELLHYRSMCLEKSVKGAGIQDIVRRIDLNFLQYQKVVEALDPAIPTNGIEVSDPDKCMLLLRSLPADCRSHIVLQFRRGTETYRGYVDAALDYENHQRMWADLPGGKVNEMYADPAEGADDEDDQLARLQGGPKRVADKNTVCFNCNGKGHFSRDCPKPRRDGGTSASSKDKPKPKAGGKGKGRGKGKKAHELTEEGGEPDAEEQVEDQTAPTEEAWSEVGESEEPSRLSMLQLAEAHMKDERAASDEAGLVDVGQRGQ